ncbi:hypothetical protein FMM05_14530 [Flavobacterium zepuense]|uniref:Lipoprotein n=1 Tax=Flavobacterium zepuense TaxID=2593302 RepID=A0A552UYV6_9FLAO|nr:hypothetical protein [Flavobacterium zepuense]TRW23405.1 hypothetical protein FMM05_14530 [Flavobacterium zepuense]
MKTFKFKFIALLVIAVSVVTACSLDGDENESYCFTQYYAAAQNVTGSDSTAVGVPITLNVSFQTMTSCETFNSFNEDTTFPKKVAVLLDKTGCQCNEVTTMVTKPYTFQAAAAGTYELRFITATEASPIVRTIVVTQP